MAVAGACAAGASAGNGAILTMLCLLRLPRRAGARPRGVVGTGVPLLLPGLHRALLLLLLLRALASLAAIATATAIRPVLRRRRVEV